GGEGGIGARKRRGSGEPDRRWAAANIRDADGAIDRCSTVPPQGPKVEPRDRGGGVVPERDARREVQSEWGGLDQGGGQTQCWNQRRAYHGPRHGEEGLMSLRRLLFHQSLGVARVDAHRAWSLPADPAAQALLFHDARQTNR